MDLVVGHELAVVAAAERLGTLAEVEAGWAAQPVAWRQQARRVRREGRLTFRAVRRCRARALAGSVLALAKSAGA